jgi:hypothetical protein
MSSLMLQGNSYTIFCCIFLCRIASVLILVGGRPHKLLVWTVQQLPEMPASQ